MSEVTVSEANISVETSAELEKSPVSFVAPIAFLAGSLLLFVITLLAPTHKDLFTEDVWKFLQGPYFICTVCFVIGSLLLASRLAAAGGVEAGEDSGTSLWNDAMRRLRKNKMAVVCTITFFLILLWCFLGPHLVYWIDGDMTQLKVDVDNKKTGMSLTHWFGTDYLGRDLMLRTMTGGQIAILVGLSATSVALFIGVVYGAFAAYAGGRVDEIMMRFVDMMYAFPRVIFIIVVMSALDTDNIIILFALIGAISWLTMARIVRGQVLSLRKQEFVEAAHSLGAGSGRTLFKHIIPNVMNVVIVYSTLSLPSVMLTEAFLSFIGLGVQPPVASWGTLVVEGQQDIMYHPMILIFPGAIMAITIFSLNFLGDGLRDALDPKMRKD